jgi:hypothetical protein
VLSTADPQVMTRYTYAADDPITGSDPTGLMPMFRDGDGCAGSAAACATRSAAMAAATVSMYYDKGSRSTILQFNSRNGSASYRYSIPDSLKDIEPENIDTAIGLNNRLAAQGNLYNNGALRGGSGNGVLYATPTEGGDTVSDLVQVTFVDGEPQSVLRVDLYSPTTSNIRTIQQEIEKKISGRQADSAVVRTANDQQANQIENDDYYFYGEDPPAKASLARFGDLITVGEPSDYEPLIVPLNPPPAPPVASSGGGSAGGTDPGNDSDDNGRPGWDDCACGGSRVPVGGGGTGDEEPDELKPFDPFDWF